MPRLSNPYGFEPATGDHFVGREDILERWRNRLNEQSDSWKTGKSWLVIAPGGLGKTSLLRQMQIVAQTERRAWTLFIDLGHFVELDSTADFFAYIETHLPPAKRLGTRMRHWFGLEPDASLQMLGTKVFSLLLKQAVAFSPANWNGLGIEISGSEIEVKTPNSIAGQLISLFNSLAVLSEEQKAPVVVFVDQVGKVYDSYRWRFIAEQLLSLVSRMRLATASNVVFVFSMRPEQKGLLDYRLRRQIFSEADFSSEHLYPLTGDEGVRAILQRGGGYISLPLATQIGKAVETEHGVEPYAVQLGAMALWEYVHRTEGTQPASVELTRVEELVRDSYAILINPIINEKPVEWEILKLLSLYPGGLTASQISQHLYNSVGTTQEVTQALNGLMNQIGYRLLTTSNSHVGAIPYDIAHDLLRDYIKSCIPETEQELEQARRMLNDSVWRYEVLDIYLTTSELELVWKYHQQLNLTKQGWLLILDSELRSSDCHVLRWVKSNSQEIHSALASIRIQSNSSEVSVKVWLLEAYLLDQVVPALFELAQQATNSRVREAAVEALGNLGEVALLVLTELVKKVRESEVREATVEALGNLGEAALPILTELAQQNTDSRVRLAAIKALGNLGEADFVLPILTELAQQSTEFMLMVPLGAIKALGNLGEADFVLPILTELAQQASDSRVRLAAIKALGNLGEADFVLPILTELAQQDTHSDVRRNAVEILGNLGEAALPILTEVAQQASDEVVRLAAAEVLVNLGEADLALPILKEVAQQASDPWVQQAVFEALGNLGEAALPILTEVAQQASDEVVRARAVEALGNLGEAALPILTEVAQQASDEVVRARAVEALGNLGEAALPILTELAQQASDTDVQHAVVTAVEKLGEAALPVLTELAQQASKSWLRLAAAEALEKLGEVGLALPVLTELAQQASESWLRLAAVKVLVNLGEADLALPVLTELAQQASDMLVRARAVEALGNLGEAALPILTELAQQASDTDVQHAVVTAVEKLGEAALPVLTELAQQASKSWLRLAAAGALQKLGKVDLALPILTEVAQQATHRKERQVAVEVLGNLGEKALPFLLKLAWRFPNDDSSNTACLRLLQIIIERGRGTNHPTLNETK